MDKTIETIPKETMSALVRHPGRGTFASCKTTLLGVLFFLMTASLNLGESRAVSRWSQRLQIQTLKEKVRREILAACQRANWKLGGPRGAAARLGLPRTTLIYKMKRLGIAPPADHRQD